MCVHVHVYVYSSMLHRGCTGSRQGIGMKVTMFGTRNMARESSSILMAPNIMVSLLHVYSVVVSKRPGTIPGEKSHTL